MAFHSVSTVTTTGFSITSSADWPFSISFLLLIGAFIGACSGSVGGGVKSWRVMIMLNHAYNNIMKIPNYYERLEELKKFTETKCNLIPGEITINDNETYSR